MADNPAQFAAIIHQIDAELIPTSLHEQNKVGARRLMARLGALDLAEMVLGDDEPTVSPAPFPERPHHYHSTGLPKGHRIGAWT